MRVLGRFGFGLWGSGGLGVESGEGGRLTFDDVDCWVPTLVSVRCACVGRRTCHRAVGSTSGD